MDEDKALHSWNPGMFKPNFGISRPFLVLTSPKLFLDTDNRVIESVEDFNFRLNIQTDLQLQPLIINGTLVRKVNESTKGFWDLKKHVLR